MGGERGGEEKGGEGKEAKGRRRRTGGKRRGVPRPSRHAVKGDEGWGLYHTVPFSLLHSHPPCFIVPYRTVGTVPYRIVSYRIVS